MTNEVLKYILPIITMSLFFILVLYRGVSKKYPFSLSQIISKKDKLLSLFQKIMFFKGIFFFLKT